MNLRTHRLGDIVALALAVVFARQVHLKIRLMRLGPQKIMPHQPVEIIRSRGAHIHLDVFYFGNAHKIIRDLRDHLLRFCLCRTVRHIEDHLELILVIKGQHLHADQFQRDQQDHGNHQNPETPKKFVPDPGVIDQRIHIGAVKAGQKIFLLPFVMDL